MKPKSGNIMFGDPNDFAIEAGVDQWLARPTQVWGHTCVWCHGVSLGNVEERHCGMGGVFSGFEWITEHIDELWDVNLVGLDDQATWNFLDGLLYGCHGDTELDDDRTLEQIKADAARYGKFDFLTNWDEQFDGYKAFILCPPGSDSVRILCHEFPLTLGLGVNVSKAGVLGASRAFIKWFHEQVQRLPSAGA